MRIVQGTAGDGLWLACTDDGAALVDHAAWLAREQGAEQLRVDCWDGVPELPAAYERLGFTRTGSFDVDGWPGAILVHAL